MDGCFFNSQNFQLLKMDLEGELIIAVCSLPKLYDTFMDRNRAEKERFWICVALTFSTGPLPAVDEEADI